MLTGTEGFVVFIGRMAIFGFVILLMTFCNELFTRWNEGRSIVTNPVAMAIKWVIVAAVLLFTAAIITSGGSIKMNLFHWLALLIWFIVVGWIWGLITGKKAY